ncbi:phage holin family protein [Methylopila sp. M107]|uniref:phage holin family protein n=1 Tax=Methylopila sp. M107 TaxID=1101190 RepID=UPI00037D3E64|nr:phage holin family protein [Methylopila sp. M107]
MLRLLMQAGLGLATFNLGRRIGQIKRLAAFMAVAGIIGLLGLGALTAALVIYLEPRLGAAGAAAAVGAGLLTLAALVGWVGTWKRKPKARTPIFERVRAEVGAAAGAVAASRARPARAARAARDEAIVDDGSPLPVPPGQKRKRAVNIVLIATLAGVILGRRL